MATSPPEKEICPYCKKPFKRLKSHLPHCKMARDPDASEVLSPAVKVCSSVMPELLKIEKKKGKIKGTEVTSKKERSSKHDLTRNKTIKPLEKLKITGIAPSSNLNVSDAIQTQIKHHPEKIHNTKGTGQRAAEEILTQPAETLTKSFTGRKIKITPEGNELVSCADSQAPIQSQNPTSESPSQTAKPFAKHRHSKEDFGKQNGSNWPDSSTEDLPSFPQGITDRIELVIENHRVRVLRNRPVSSVQNMLLNGAAISNKTSLWLARSSPGGEKIDSFKEQQVGTVTQSGGGKNALGLELAENVASEVKEGGITIVKTHTLPDNSGGSCKKVSRVSHQLGSEFKNIIDENPLVLKKEEECPKESHMYITPKPEMYVAFVEVCREKDDNKILNCSETSTSFLSAIAATQRRKSSKIPFRAPSIHMLESTSAHGLPPQDKSMDPSSLGLEFIPELYSNYLSLGLLSRRRPQWNVRIPGAQVLILHSEVPLAETSLMNVKLQDLPAWLATCDLSPQGMLRVTRRAWNGYYNKYINVKKGGVAGISMLLLGYCILSYSWSYEHIKQSRWRKYH